MTEKNGNIVASTTEYHRGLQGSSRLVVVGVGIVATILLFALIFARDIGF